MKLRHVVKVTNPKTKVGQSRSGGHPITQVGGCLTIVYNYYKTNFSLMQHHKYSLTELDNMIPFEEIYVELLMQWIKEENERLKEQRGNDR